MQTCLVNVVERELFTLSTERKIKITPPSERDKLSDHQHPGKSNRTCQPQRAQDDLIRTRGNPGLLIP